MARTTGLVFTGPTEGWVLLADGAKFAPLSLQGAVEAVAPSSSPIQAEQVATSVTGEPVIGYMAGQRFGVFSIIDLESGPFMNTYTVWPAGSVASFSVEGASELKISLDDAAHQWETYSFNPVLGNFSKTSEYKSARRAAGEAAIAAADRIFSARLETTIRDLESLLVLPAEVCGEAGFDAYQCQQQQDAIPRLWYTLGLAYELMVKKRCRKCLLATMARVSR
jgi:hypothetical protein